MAYRNLDEFIIRLEQHDELITVDTPITDGTQIVQQTQPQARALWFNHVSGSNFPVVTNLFGSPRRMAWALGLDTLDTLTDNLATLINLDFSEGFSGLLNRAGMMMSALRSAGVVNGRVYGDIPVQKHRAPTIAGLPHLRLWPQESHPTLTMAQIIISEPTSGKQIITTGRVALIDATTIAIDTQQFEIHERASIAVVFGGDPAAMWSASVPMPQTLTPYWLAGWLRRKAVPMVKAVSQPVYIPGDAEIVIEGVFDPAADTIPATFAGDNGFLVCEYPLSPVTVTAMTHRTNAICPVHVPFTDNTEQYYHNIAIEHLLVPVLKTMLEEVVAVHQPRFATGNTLTLASCHNYRPGIGMKTLHGIWSVGALAETKTVIIVDETVDVTDYKAVLKAILHNVHWKRDMLSTHGARHRYDAFTPTYGYGSKLGIDATHKPDASKPPPTMPDTLDDLGNGLCLWHNVLIVPVETAVDDLTTYRESLWQQYPDCHLIFVDQTAHNHDLSQTIGYVLAVVDWEHDIYINYQTCAQGRVAIHAIGGDRARTLRLNSQQ